LFPFRVRERDAGAVQSLTKDEGNDFVSFQRHELTKVHEIKFKRKNRESRMERARFEMIRTIQVTDVASLRENYPVQVVEGLISAQ